MTTMESHLGHWSYRGPRRNLWLRWGLKREG